MEAKTAILSLTAATKASDRVEALTQLRDPERIHALEAAPDRRQLGEVVQVVLGLLGDSTQIDAVRTEACAVGSLLLLSLGIDALFRSTCVGLTVAASKNSCERDQQASLFAAQGLFLLSHSQPVLKTQIEMSLPAALRPLRCLCYVQSRTYAPGANVAAALTPTVAAEAHRTILELGRAAARSSLVQAWSSSSRRAYSPRPAKKPPARARLQPRACSSLCSRLCSRRQTRRAYRG